MEIKTLTQDLSVSGQVRHSDLSKIAAQGFQAVINNRPDREVPFQPRTKSLEWRAKQAGLEYHYLPVVSGHVTQKNIDDFAALLERVKGPVLAFCRTGTRSANLWAQVNTSGLTQEEITRIGLQAGYAL